MNLVTGRSDIALTLGGSYMVNRDMCPSGQCIGASYQLKPTDFGISLSRRKVDFQLPQLEAQVFTGEKIKISRMGEAYFLGREEELNFPEKHVVFINILGGITNIC
ncbi:hypothetical protein P5673_024578 [Acropora cervicornis]|uniref:Uncharacterized protein n=1 Tax=Acropora cervicornis TaxID=6130 RepID=A0AAD9Q344_ACRCE|nr:hypothetical protein P5673_024578 [Acropora cervicornis]